MLDTLILSGELAKILTAEVLGQSLRNVNSDTFVMAAQAVGTLDMRSTINILVVDGNDANWDSCRTHFEAYANLVELQTRSSPAKLWMLYF